MTDGLERKLRARAEFDGPGSDLQTRVPNTYFTNELRKHGNTEIKQKLGSQMLKRKHITPFTRLPR